jgi:CheY-like chemotaxis protein
VKQLSNLLERINSKILLKINLLVIIEIILIVGCFGVLAYFQSQQSSLGNSVNIAGKNRYLTANLLLQTEKYLDGTSDAAQLKAAMNSLQSNIITLKQGGMISGVDLKPLPSYFFNLWNIVNRNWNLYITSVTQILPHQQVKRATSSSALTTTRRAIDQLLLEKQFESMASDLIASSDRLVTQLGLQTDKNSDDLIVYQVLFAILIVSILVLILYLVARMLKPIFDLTQGDADEHIIAVPASPTPSLLLKAERRVPDYDKQHCYRKRIVIIDDEPDITVSFEKLLKDNGFENIYTANNPLLFLKNFKQGSYDLLIIDVVMQQMDGFCLYEEIRKIDNKVKVCFITAFEVNYQALRAAFPAATTTDDIGCFIRKPVDMDDLVKHVKRELDHD